LPDQLHDGLAHFPCAAFASKIVMQDCPGNLIARMPHHSDARMQQLALQRVALLQQGVAFVLLALVLCLCIHSNTSTGSSTAAVCLTT
jgi:hypothetical protein